MTAARFAPWHEQSLLPRTRGVARPSDGAANVIDDGVALVRTLGEGEEGRGRGAGRPIRGTSFVLVRPFCRTRNGSLSRTLV